jgi:hypothetical protein
MTGGTDDDDFAKRWQPLLAVIGALAAGSAWIAALGTAVMALRLNRVGVPPSPSVSLLPTDLRVVLGVRYLLIPVGMALVGFVVLLLLRKDGDGPRNKNEKNKVPRGLFWILAVLFVVGTCAVAASDLDSWQRVLLVVGCALAAGATYAAVWRVSGLGQGALVYLAAVLVFSGLLSLAFEAMKDPKLDVGVVVRKDGKSAVGGFYVARSDSSVLMVVPELNDGQRPTISTGKGARPIPPQRCDKRDDPVAALADGAPGCYQNVLMVIPTDDVRRFTIGPQGVRATPTGYRAALRLARAALLQKDERLPEKKRQAKPKK